MSTQRALPDGPRTTTPVRRAAKVLLAVVLTAALVSVEIWQYTEPTRHVPVPAADATPQQVVKAYLDGSTTHDVATMNALTTGDRMPHEGRFDRTWMVDQVKVFDPRPEEGAGSLWSAWEQVQRVDVDVTTLRSGGLNFPDGEGATWGYILVRHHDDDPWRIIEQGVG